MRLKGANYYRIRALTRMQITDMSSIIRRECRSITNKLSNDFEESWMHRFTSNDLKHEWVTQQLIDKQTFSTVIRFAFWTNSMRFDLDAIHFNTWNKEKWIAFTLIAERRNELNMRSSCSLRSRLRSISSTKNVLNCTMN
jgi:hypothetical protein